MPDDSTYLCPFCGREARVGAPCPGCPEPRKRKKTTGSRNRKSWEQDEGADGLDLPDEDFDYDAFVAREFGGPPHRRIGVKLHWWLLGVVLLGVITLLWVIRLRG